jgi:hypothetical protein
MSVEVTKDPQRFLSNLREVHPLAKVFADTFEANALTLNTSTYDCMIYRPADHISILLATSKEAQNASIGLRDHSNYIELSLYPHDAFSNYISYRQSPSPIPVISDRIRREVLEGGELTPHDRIAFSDNTYPAGTWMDEPLRWMFEVMADHMKRRNAVIASLKAQ